MTWLLLGLLLVGCPRKAPPPPVAAAPSSAGFMQLQTRDPAEQAPLPPKMSSEQARVLAVFEAAQPQAMGCYQRTVAEDPYAYGEVVVRFLINADGAVEQATTVMETVGNADLVACVEAVVAGLHFRSPVAGQLTGRYPFIFTSDLTPPEVVRALKTHYGLLPAEEVEDDGGFPLLELGPGTINTW